MLFTDAENELLTKNGWDDTVSRASGSVAYKSWKKIVKLADDSFDVYHWMDDGEGQGYWEWDRNVKSLDIR